MVVISDTSPLNYLVLIGEISLLPRLFGRVLVPGEVMEELKRAAPSGPVSQWLASQPDWLITVDVRFTRLPSLDLGETAAIALAKQFPGEALLVVDDLLGRRAARAAGVEATGTIGVLQQAAARGWIDLPDAIRRLQSTNFRISRALLEQVLRPPAS